MSGPTTLATTLQVGYDTRYDTWVGPDPHGRERRVDGAATGYGDHVEQRSAAVEAVPCASCGTVVPPDATACPGCGTLAPPVAERREAARQLPTLPGYTVLEPLGWGGTAVVYRALQANLDREVAVKLIRHEVGDPRAWRRFEREARIIASLSGHPHVVTIYDVGRTPSGQPFLVTELLDRGALSEVVTREGPLGAERAVEIGRAVASALTAAHAQGILHRDLKPGNVLLGSRGQIKLADFGIARLAAGQTTVTSTKAFTPEHAAPEVLRGEEEGPAADVYGLASTIATALLGRSLFAPRDGERVEAMMWRKVSEAAPFLPPSVPPALAHLIRRCLATDPAARPDLPTVAAELDRLRDPAALAPAAAVTVQQPVTHRPAAALAATRVVPATAAATARPTAADADDGDRDLLAAASAPYDWDARQRRIRAVWWATALAVLLALGGALATMLRGGSDGGADAGDLPPIDTSVVVTDPASAPAATAPGAAPAATDPAVTDPPATQPVASAPVDTVSPAAATLPPATPPATLPPATQPPATVPAGTQPQPATQQPVATEPVVTEPAAAEPAATEPAAQAPQPGEPGTPIGEDEALAFVLDYYGLVAAGDRETGWDHLSEEFRAGRDLSYEEYVRYWSRTSIEIGRMRYLPSDEPNEARVRFEASYTTGGRVIDQVDQVLLRREPDGRIVFVEQGSVGSL